MARGIARVMGFRMMLNFNNPYTAVDLGDFWCAGTSACRPGSRTISISLGRQPPGEVGHVSQPDHHFVVSGIWHGANWTFVVWGGLHALGRCGTRGLERSRWYTQKVPRLVKQAWVFAFVCFAWIFFRAQNLQDAWLIIERIGAGGWTDPAFLFCSWCWSCRSGFTSCLFERRAGRASSVSQAGAAGGLVLAMIVYLLTVAQPGSRQFIYFQF